MDNRSLVMGSVDFVGDQKKYDHDGMEPNMSFPIPKTTRKPAYPNKQTVLKELTANQKRAIDMPEDLNYLQTKKQKLVEETSYQTNKNVEHIMELVMKYNGKIIYSIFNGIIM
eukprot:NODE_766_length_4057_cov_0.510106.p1 type:complete len:113 gc:universal NODE_766_length_4057_cov_0.510106:1123-785(-)